MTGLLGVRVIFRAQSEGIFILAVSLIRSATSFVGPAALATTMTIATSQLSLAADDPSPLTTPDEITIRGEIKDIRAATKSFGVEGNDRDYLVFRASDRITNFASLKLHDTVDVKYYRTVEYMIGKTTPEVTAKADKLVAIPVRTPAVLGVPMQINLRKISGWVVSVDMPANKLEIVDPLSGQVIKTPWLKGADAQAVLATLKPGDDVTAVFSQRTAFEVTVIR